MTRSSTDAAQLHLMIERYTQRRNQLRQMLADGYTGGRKLEPVVRAEVEGQEHELAHFVEDLKALLDRRYE